MPKHSSDSIHLHPKITYYHGAKRTHHFYVLNVHTSPCSAIRSGAHAPGRPSMLVTPSVARFPRRSCKWRYLFGGRPSPFAADIAFPRIRPRQYGPCPLTGCWRTRRGFAVIPRFSIHLSLCSTDFRRFHRSYEKIRLLRRALSGRPFLLHSTAEAGLWKCLEVRMPCPAWRRLPNSVLRAADIGRRVPEQASLDPMARVGVHSR